MIKALFISDLHGSKQKYDLLFKKILSEKPAAVFIGGDLLGFTGLDSTFPASFDFFYDFLQPELQRLRTHLKKEYPQVYIILGNDDSKSHEDVLIDISTTGLLTYVHDRKVQFMGYSVVGYSYVPPSPFLNKDWEKYDVSQFTDVGCVSPEEGYRSIAVLTENLRFYTIKYDLDVLFKNSDMNKTICLFHTPPYQTHLDRAALDGKMIDYAPLDVHVGSIAVKKFIEKKQPYITLHGHIHESTRITGLWNQKIGKTFSFQGASETDEYAILIIDIENPQDAVRVVKQVL
jgi:uncharacterized protein